MPPAQLVSTDLAGSRGRGAEPAERAPAAFDRQNPRGQQGRNNDRQLTQINQPGRLPVNFKYTNGRLNIEYVGTL